MGSATGRTAALALAISLAAAALGGCDRASAGASAEAVRGADEYEAAFPLGADYVGRHGGDSPLEIKDYRKGAGTLAGQAVLCGSYVGTPANSIVAEPRVIRIGVVNVVEGEIGQKPGVFDELWRRGGCGAPLPVAAPAGLDPAIRVKAEAALKGEQQIASVAYDPGANAWTIGMRDDGTRRFGYAEFVCLRLNDVGAMTAGSRVVIVDQADAAKELGGVECANGSRIAP